MQQCVVPRTICFSKIDSLQDVEDLLLVEKADQGFLGALLGDAKDCVDRFRALRREKAQHFGKGLEGCKALVSSFWKVFSIFFKPVEESQYEFAGEVLYGERFGFDAVIVCREWNEELEGIAVCLYGMRADPFDMGQVVSRKTFG